MKIPDFFSDTDLKHKKVKRRRVIGRITNRLFDSIFDASSGCIRSHNNSKLAAEGF